MLLENLLLCCLLCFVKCYKNGTFNNGSTLLDRSFSRKSPQALMMCVCVVFFFQPSSLVTRIHPGAAQPSTIQLLRPCPLLLPTQQPTGHRQCHTQTTSSIARRRAEDVTTKPNLDVLSLNCKLSLQRTVFIRTQSTSLTEVFDSRLIPGKMPLAPAFWL